ncbi:hypothetical protein [Sulfurimonas sp. HSL3-7]|uniref:EF-hand domain-containing protein n=1 Tax=Sulfonitrofixus jiaomeiensis TaxID=3131938 RepID=UPI0031F9CFD6
MMGIKHFAVLLLFGYLLSGCSLFKPHFSDEQMHSYLFNKFDSNEDGIITRNEYRAFIDERFDKMNPDGGETITKEELYKTRFYMFLPDLAQAVFRDSDSDADGLITREEMVTAEKVRFRQMDSNQDGSLAFSEFVVNDRSAFKE